MIILHCLSILIQKLDIFSTVIDMEKILKVFHNDA